MSTIFERKSKTRTMTAIAAVAAATAAGAFSIQTAAADETDHEAAQACSWEALPIPEGLRTTQVTGMSDDGSVIAYQALPVVQNGPEDWVNFPHLYAGGEATEVRMPGEYPELLDVNSAEVAVGLSYVDSAYVPYVWRDGELDVLPSAGSAQARGINEDGDIVGVDQRRPVLWPADGSGPVELPLPDGAESGTAHDIGYDGTVVGAVYDENGTAKAYTWRPDASGDHVGGELPLPPAADPADHWTGIAWDINGDWASGHFYSPGTGSRAQGIRWNLADGTAEMTELNRQVAVSADGTVAGYHPDTDNAAYQDGDTVVELPGVDSDVDLPRDVAVEISADGSLIAGNLYVRQDADGSYVQNAVIWTCE
ncbi:hypothetical protein [Glycomyces tenuis]|uniref:hypothetical protein n=1 Tax=Glycomyces tenuis TaxID=58116 RepID=UPI000421278B|nr:hypothetical protein [Glycomyces tenuis]